MFTGKRETSRPLRQYTGNELLSEKETSPNATDWRRRREISFGHYSDRQDRKPFVFLSR